MMTGSTPKPIGPDGSIGARWGRKPADRRPARRSRPLGRLDRRGRGFSLIELLVVISLIIILVALLINALIENRGPVTATRTTMAALLNMATEYKVLTAKTIDPIATTFDMAPPPSTPGISIERFVKAMESSPDLKKMLDALGPEVYTDIDADGYREVVDGWENPIEYRAYSSGTGVGAATDPTPDPNLAFKARGTATSPQVFFASKGRDQKWGDYQAATNTDSFKWTRDNLFSFDLQ